MEAESGLARFVSCRVVSWTVGLDEEQLLCQSVLCCCSGVSCWRVAVRCAVLLSACPWLGVRRGGVTRRPVQWQRRRDCGSSSGQSPEMSVGRA